MKETILSISKWHEETFPDETLDGQVSKYREEFKEWADSNCMDVFELADMFIVACGISRFDIYRGMFYLADVYDWLRADIPFDTDEFIDAVNEKMKKNRERVWAKTGEGQYHHVNQ